MDNTEAKETHQGFEKHEYEVRVSYEKYEDQHLCFSFFKIMAKDYMDAEKEAKKQFAEMIGAKDTKHMTAFTIDKYKHSK
ncbi:MAG: hypothetical protein V4547_17150 [Bacteroidota bacterium]